MIAQFYCDKLYCGPDACSVEEKTEQIKQETDLSSINGNNKEIESENGIEKRSKNTSEKNQNNSGSNLDFFTSISKVKELVFKNNKNVVFQTLKKTTARGMKGLGDYSKSDKFKTTGIGVIAGLTSKIVDAHKNSVLRKNRQNIDKDDNQDRDDKKYNMMFDWSKDTGLTGEQAKEVADCYSSYDYTKEFNKNLNNYRRFKRGTFKVKRLKMLELLMSEAIKDHELSKEYKNSEYYKQSPLYNSQYRLAGRALSILEDVIADYPYKDLYYMNKYIKNDQLAEFIFYVIEMEQKGSVIKPYNEHGLTSIPAVGFLEQVKNNIAYSLDINIRKTIFNKAASDFLNKLSDEE